MAITDILKPKTKEDINIAILDLLDNTLTLPQFLIDFELLKNIRVIKAYDFIRINYLKALPDEIFIVYKNNPLYNKITWKLGTYYYTNQVIKNIKFIAGPYTHALIKKNSRVAELYGTIQAIMIPRNRILDILTEK